MKGLILAGGSGSRLRPITHTGAKQLVPVANKPILFYGLDQMAAAGITEVGLVVGDTAREIVGAVGDGSGFGLRVTYLRQDAPLGLAHAVRIARDFLGDDDFVMYLGDNLLRQGLGDFVARFEADHAAQRSPRLGGARFTESTPYRPRATIVRTSWLNGTGGGFVRTVLDLAADPERPLAFVDDQWGCPTLTADLAPVVVALSADRSPGVHHVTNEGATTWHGPATAVLAAAGHDPVRARPIATAELDPPRAAPRPALAVLDNAVLRLSGRPPMPPWRDGLPALVHALLRPRSGL